MRLLNLPRFIIVLIIVLAIGLVAALFSRSSFFGPESTKDFPGSLVLSFAQPWTAPTGEVVSGLITYTPATGAVSYVLVPNQGITPLLSPGALSGDGARLLAINHEGTSTALVAFSIAHQSIERVIATLPMTTAVIAPHWSPDMHRTAYLTVPFAHPGEAKLEIEGVPSALGALPALTFSPDGQQLAVFSTQGLTLVSLNGGVSRIVSGVPDPQTVAEALASPDGTLLAVLTTDDTLALYAIAWDTATLVRESTVSVHSGGYLVFGSRAIWVTDPTGVVARYAIQGHRLVRPVQYKLVLPPDSRILALWP